MLPNISAKTCALFLLAAVSTVGCTKASVIGTVCKSQSDCNVEGEVCAPGFNAGPTICTRKCTGETGPTGCPIGYDCFPTDTKLGPTCNKTLYEVNAMTGKPVLFGVDCALKENVCTSLGSTNAAITCRKIPDESATPVVPVDQDPTAYCTGVCANDNDCPLDFRCGTDYDMKKKCLRRSLCTECTVDANCGGEFPVCIPTKDGTSRYCSKPCTSTGDCGGVQNSALACGATTNAAGAAISACMHKFGSCVGQGNICDPCRTKADCAKSGSECAENPSTLERFCTKSCKTDTDCAAFGTVKSTCDNTSVYDPQTNPGGMSILVCNGDTTHLLPGLYSCWVPE